MNEKNNQLFIFYIIIATLPAIFAGLLLKDYFLKIFDNVHLVGFALCSTGFLLILSKRFKNNQKAIIIFFIYFSRNRAGYSNYTWYF